MAERRMITKKVTDDENFFALSSSAQALYLHLSMSADDDGFCNQISVSMFKAHASVQDLQSLLENNGQKVRLPEKELQKRVDSAINH